MKLTELIEKREQLLQLQKELKREQLEIEKKTNIVKNELVKLLVRIEKA